MQRDRKDARSRRKGHRDRHDGNSRVGVGGAARGVGVDQTRGAMTAQASRSSAVAETNEIRRAAQSCLPQTAGPEKRAFSSALASNSRSLTPADKLPPTRIHTTNAGVRIRGYDSRAQRLRACGTGEIPLFQLWRCHVPDEENGLRPQFELLTTDGSARLGRLTLAHGVRLKRPHSCPWAPTGR